MKKVYMIGNTHFDPVWLWKWDEAMSSITATFRSALERMKEYPDFKYSFATPPVFEWIKKTSPEMFEEIKERVKEGRWELAEGWWVQPDCYTPAGESLVRQGLYGQKYLFENFGAYSDTVFNIDSFGHPPTLPQILAKSHIKYYVLCRPEGRHIELSEPLFNWKSKDGTTILTYRDDSPYRNNTLDAIAEAKKLPYDTMQVFGVTDHGGAPTIKSIKDIYESDIADFATVKEFFENRKTGYTVDTEFITGDFGVYANHSETKALNRKAEYAVLNAEKASVIAEKYDTDALKKCWHDILFNQFHDILGGACIKEAYYDSRNVYGRAISTANEITHYNLLSVTNNIKMPGTNPDTIWNIVVWNLNAWDFDGYIEAEVQWAHEFPWYDKGIALEDTDGNRYECQIVRERSVIPRFRSRFLFKARIPSVGYKAFRLIQTGEEINSTVPSNLFEIETDRYIVKLSPNGEITSVYDKNNGKDICGRLLVPVCYVDDGDTWAFNIDSYGEMCEPFRLEKLESTENGKLRTILKATYTFRSSRLVLYYTIYRQESYIDVRYKVNWNEKHLVFKLVTDIASCKHTASVPYGSAERNETKADVPVGEWLSTEALDFCTDRIFAYSASNNLLGLTVLRSPIYGDLRIDDIDLDTDYDILEQGITEGNIRVFFEKKHNLPQKAAEFNNPPLVLCEASHDGTLTTENSFLTIDAQSVSVTVLKKAEDEDCMIVRGIEHDGISQKIKITTNESIYELDINPYEIFTARIDNSGIQKTDMLES
ncbi:MAG: alpha-mannosidase [Ruminococcaceae bacterium]|nr:alpha-mannosidase [Oscillospiraceae bacterium]